MNNKTIVLGTITLDWHFAKGCYTCNCAILEDANAFDRAICGILYSSNGDMSKQILANILGFNYKDDPANNLYCDKSEKVIFDNAVASLVEYGLIIDDSISLRLTETGKKSFETRTKQRFENKDVELWTSEFTGLGSCSEFIKGLSIHTIEKDCLGNTEWNALQSCPLDVLKHQNEELFNIGAGKSVTSMTHKCTNYYVANLKCNICYNLETQLLYAYPSTESDGINSILSRNAIIQERLIDEFFKSQRESVIYKPSHQFEKEDFILRQNREDNTYSFLITCKDYFFSKLNTNLKNDKVPIVFFNFQKITEDIRNYLKLLNDVIVCVDYVEESFDDVQDNSPYYVDKNVCYYRIENERTSDLCVYDNIYYSIFPHIVKHKGVDYSIPLVYKLEEDKYNHSSLFAPYAKHILDYSIKVGNMALDGLKRDQSPKHINTVLQYCMCIGKIDIAKDDSTLIERQNQFGRVTERLLETWNNILHDKLNKLDAELLTGGDKHSLIFELKEIEDITKSVIEQDEEVLSHIEEIKQRISSERKLTMPMIQQQRVYVLDTSVFMDIPDILVKFSLVHDRVFVPRAMEQELDGLSHDKEKGEKANKALKLLRRYKNDYPHFVSIKDNVDDKLLPPGFDSKKKDNDLLATAIELEKKVKCEKVIIVANDNEFISNVKDCVNVKIISDRIEGIDLNELLIRLSD